MAEQYITVFILMVNILLHPCNHHFFFNHHGHVHMHASRHDIYIHTLTYLFLIEPILCKSCVLIIYIVLIKLGKGN